MNWADIHPILYFLLSAFLFKAITELVYSLKFIWHKPQIRNELLPVSVVICARNEEENLLEFIPKIMEQEYPQFEVVIVNDRSIDDTHLVLRAFENRYSNLNITAVEKTELHWAGKKFALSIGIKAASYKHVLLTDADCVPSSSQWLKEMAQCFSAKHKVILGFGAYEKQPGMLNGIIRGETLLIGQQYLGLALCGFPYMGVGRNLAYHTNLFFDNRGFASHQFLPSGDDDLFINEVAHAKNIQVCFNEKSFTLSKPETRWKDYAEQKRRHLTTGSKYNLRSKLILSWLTLVRYSFLLSIALGFMYLPPMWSSAVFLANSMLLFALHYPTAKTINARELLPFLGLIEIFLHLFYPILFIWNTFVSGSPWKNY